MVHSPLPETLHEHPGQGADRHLALTCTLAAAAPQDELHAAMMKFLGVQSFHASMTDVEKGQQISAAEFVAPDRYRRVHAESPQQLVIGGAIYMDMGGRMARLPIPGASKLIARFRNENFLKEMEAGMTVQALPDESLGGEAARVYACATSKPKGDTKIRVSRKSGLPLQVESSSRFMGRTSTVRVGYSNFNDPAIHIDVPNE